jgi:hypothetical protein
LVGDKQLILQGLKRLGDAIVELDVDGRRLGNYKFLKSAVLF